MTGQDEMSPESFQNLKTTCGQQVGFSLGFCFASVCNRSGDCLDSCHAVAQS